MPTDRPILLERQESLCERIRSSKTIIVIIVFFSLVSDSMLLTLVDPILPDILRNIDNRTVQIDSNLEAPGEPTVSSPLQAEEDTEISDSINHGGRYGYLVAAKGLTQFICNPFVGALVSRFGYRRPMLVGSGILLLSTAAFAFGSSYAVLFATRMVQGSASSVTAVTGMGLLAATYDDDEKRGKVMGIAIGGISMGIIVGPIYGSVLYQLFGQAVPFLALSGMVFFSIILQVFAFKGDPGAGKSESLTEIIKLLMDPYILIVAGNVFFLNLDVSIVLAFLPIRLIDLEDPEPWKLGIVVLPTSIGYMLAGFIFPRTTRWLRRWLCALIGLVISSLTLFFLAYSRTFELMLVITTFLGLALGMVSTSMQPIFAHLVDIRHAAVYGNVYAISDMAVCLAMSIGPLAGGPAEYALGFEWMVVGVGILNLCFSQFSFMLRNPPPRNGYKPMEKAKPFCFEGSGASNASSNSITEYYMDGSNEKVPLLGNEKRHKNDNYC